MTVVDSPAVLELSDITKTFGTTRALNSISLRVRRGEFVTLLGPSGSGKTTTLNVIAGFLAPDQGEVLVNGVPVGSVPAHRRNIGVVFQHYALFPHLTVHDNIAFPLRQRRAGRAAVAARVAEVLELVRLPGHGRRYPRELSGGQQQRVALARAVVFSPEILLMDEPLGALDKRLRDQMQLELRRIHSDLGITVVYVTHDREEALTLSDRIAVFRAGAIEQQGTPRELYQQPRSVFVAQFLGEANCFGGALRRDGDHVTVIGDGFTIRAPAPAETFLDQGVVVVRPEQLSVTPAGGAAALAPAGTNCVDAVVDDVVYLGGSTRVTLVYAGGATGAARGDWTRLTQVKRGDRVRVSWQAGDGVLIAAQCSRSGG